MGQGGSGKLPHRLVTVVNDAPYCKLSEHFNLSMYLNLSSCHQTRAPSEGWWSHALHPLPLPSEDHKVTPSYRLHGVAVGWAVQGAFWHPPTHCWVVLESQWASPAALNGQPLILTVYGWSIPMYVVQSGKRNPGQGGSGTLDHHWLLVVVYLCAIEGFLF